MKFSLQNILLAIGFLATWLGLILSDPDIQRKAEERNRQLELIENSKRFQLPITQDEVRAYAKRHAQRVGQIASN